MSCIEEDEGNQVVLDAEEARGKEDRDAKTHPSIHTTAPTSDSANARTAKGNPIKNPRGLQSSMPSFGSRTLLRLLVYHILRKKETGSSISFEVFKAAVAELPEKPLEEKGSATAGVGANLGVEELVDLATVMMRVEWATMCHQH